MWRTKSMHVDALNLKAIQMLLGMTNGLRISNRRRCFSPLMNVYIIALRGPYFLWRSIHYNGSLKITLLQSCFADSVEFLAATAASQQLYVFAISADSCFLLFVASSWELIVNRKWFYHAWSYRGMFSRLKPKDLGIERLRSYYGVASSSSGGAVCRHKACWRRCEERINSTTEWSVALSMKDSSACMMSLSTFDTETNKQKQNKQTITSQDVHMSKQLKIKPLTWTSHIL